MRSRNLRLFAGLVVPLVLLALIYVVPHGALWAIVAIALYATALVALSRAAARSRGQRREAEQRELEQHREWLERISPR